MALVGHWKLIEDSLFLGTELVTNGNMELDSDWDNQASPATNVRSDEQAHSGIYSRKITLDGIGSFGGISSANEITFVVGKSYIITGWAYNLNMSNGERLVMDCTQFSAGAFSIYPNQGVWTQWSAVVVATQSSRKILFYNYPTDIANANASFYIDDVSIKEIYFEDDSGNGNNGTPANPPVFTTNQQGRADRAVVNNRVADDRVAIGDVAAFDFTTETFSVLFWMYGNDFTTIRQGLVNKYSGVADKGWMIWIDHTTTSLQIILNNNEAIVRVKVGAAGYGSTGAWMHCAFVYNGVGNPMPIYLDGAERTYFTQQNGVAINSPAGLNLIIADRSDGLGTYPLDGNICNVRIDSPALSEAEIISIYNSELFWHTELITGQMDFAGRLSAQNPEWLLLDKSLNWIGEWDEVYSYNINDTVLYKISDGNEWHIFVSKTNHNVGNVPTTSAAYWRRYYQEQLL